LTDHPLFNTVSFTRCYVRHLAYKTVVQPDSSQCLAAIEEGDHVQNTCSNFTLTLICHDRAFYFLPSVLADHKNYKLEITERPNISIAYVV